ITLPRSPYLCSLHLLQRERYQLQFQSYDCQNNFHLFGNVSCRIGPENIGRLSADTEVLAPINRLWIKYKAVVSRPTQNTSMVLLDSKFEVCQFLREGVIRDRLALLIMRSMVKVSNLPISCPISQVAR
ncbi:hypothetical protein KR222_006497, partial [Zaprionus bogoriensis]